MVKNTNLLTTSEAAKRLGVTTQTIRNWMRDRQIGFIAYPSGSIRIEEEEVDRIKKASERKPKVTK